jgi:DNA-binding phage protein
VIDVEYIGKEANQWEEQFFLGETPEAQIEYDRHPDQREILITILTKAARTHGMENLARAAHLSRKQLHSILSGAPQPKRRTVIRLCKALVELQCQTRTF